ncbi:flagellar hook-associated protein FlgL [Succinimonas sp.]|uniref:flagellar hook-associated protein FlgL n=1 Tax=Succinimonas sp. TaxID=1936151 RepID=UPI00386CFD4D
MRVTTGLSFDRSVRYMQNSNARLESLDRQYNTGAKFATASENPTGMGTKLRLDAEIASYKQYSVNAGLAADQLNLEETALSSIYEYMLHAVTSMQAGVNGTYDQANFNTVAQDLEETRDMLFNLMNTKTAGGEYIFSGNQSLTPAFSRTSDGAYICNADGGRRQVKVSPSVTLTTSDSALSVFEKAPLCRTAASPTPGVTLSYENSDEFDSFVNGYTNAYDSNDLNISVTGDAYTITGRGGETLQTGTVSPEGIIDFKGLEITMPPGMDSAVISLDPPANDNALNTLTGIINVLRDESISAYDKAQALRMGQVSLNGAKENVNLALGHVGSRLSNIDAVINSNDALSDIKTEVRANECEVDVYEVVAELLQEQNALNVARQTFSSVHGETLFDYIR